MPRTISTLALIAWAVTFSSPAPAVILWSVHNGGLVHKTGLGVDILGGALRRTETNTDTLYFKFHVDPLSDAYDEPYSAGFQLFEGNQPRLGVGNAYEAWAYSAFNTAELGPFNQITNYDNYEYNLQSSDPEVGSKPGTFRPYELVLHGAERTIVFKVQYVPGADALVTVWLNPNLTHGWSEKNQPTNLTTKFKANACFDQIHLVHNGGGNGWVFSDMAIATSFDDFVVVRYWQTWWFTTLVALAVLFLLFSVGATVRVVEKRKYQLQLQRAEQERALERERSRIAQDLHDDLGSSLTRLTLLSGLVKADKDHPEQVEVHANKLSLAADQTVRALEEIVWAVRPGSDTLQSLIDYTTHFANELFDGNTARCRMDLPGNLPALPLPPEMRHNIFLIVKEALTNALKHSGAGEVHVQARLDGYTLQILVADDGKGFDPASPAEGRRNGMGNMRRRAAAMNASLDVQSTPGKGTKVTLSVVLRKPSLAAAP
ncbi:MAG TPA: sensor histidine kinase [Alphaproteobacteria bacterium]|nr:sensor histidine kinase [Alphaproteobacteria bacterium]